MTTATVKIVATRFLMRETPEVLVLKGAWGVGKTFAWNQLVHDHKEKIKLANYCYVSLFGISSITELRTAIFAKTKSVKLLGEKLDAKTVNNEWATLATEKVRALTSKLSQLKDFPYMKNISVGLETLAPHLIRNTIICLDDFERLNPELIEPDEILGFISELKEEKGCKIVLIFNEDELKSKEVYQKYREKVIDIELLYAPTSNEAAELALPVAMPYREMVKKHAVSLGITNIRILRKIVNLNELIHNEICTLHNGVMEQALSTLVLLVWCYYDLNEKKPTLDFIIDWNRIAWGISDRSSQDDDPKHAEWVKILQNYGLLHMDEFDQTIYKVIARGYLEETGLCDEAIKLDAQIRANELEQSFTVAWNLFHNTFSENQTELVQALGESFKKSVRHISPINLNGTTRLLRQLDQGGIADELIDYYIETRADECNLFNLSEHPFSGDINDPAIWERFNKKYAESRPVMPLIGAVEYIAANNGWSREHIEALKNATEDDFYNLFKREYGENLSKIVKSCLQYLGWDNDDKSIGLNARAALIRIGKESQLNAIRVRRYGITIDNPDTALKSVEK